MPAYHLKITQGEFSSDTRSLMQDDAAAREEARNVCAELARDTMLTFESNGNWQLELSNEAGVAIYVLKISAGILA